MSNFWQRTITGLSMVTVLLFALWYNHWLFAGIFLVVVILALWEFYSLLGKGNFSPQKVYGVAGGSLLYLSLVFYDSPALAILSGKLNPSVLLGLLVFFLSFIIEIYRRKPNPLLNIALTLTGIIYIALPLGLLNRLNSDDAVRFLGFPAILLGYFVLTWFFDTGAYLFGKEFGKHRFFERISPKKTWEGTVAGFIVAILTAAGFSFLVREIRLTDWLALTALIIVFGSFGDLAESLFKRSLNLKDSGNILPGHGGLLDRFDTVFISAPFVFLYCILRNLI